LLAGFQKPSAGTITFEGKDIQGLDSQSRRQLGIEMVHQHFKLVPAFTLRQNFRLSQLGLGNTDPNLPEKTAESLGWEIPWDEQSDEVSVGVEQRVEILKALANDAKVIIFDEPTAVLSEVEAEQLFAVMRMLAQRGKIVILIAHKIAEILACADVVTVLRKGQHIGTQTTDSVTADQLVEMMVGEPIAPRTALESSPGEALITCEQLIVQADGRTVVQGVSREFRAGTIYGFGGVDGNGQLELAEALAGLRSYEGKRTVNAKLGYIPQDRQKDGLAVELSLADNLALQQATQSCWFNPQEHFERAKRLISTYSVKAESPHDVAGQLSGGNQQKAVIARVLDESPMVIIAVNPTRGLDVKASEFVRSQLAERAQAGAAVLLFSTDRDELGAICHEICYMASGRLYGSEQEALAS
ncbi:MAG TPA: ATP-binding cassette domain-containing protein, partial [Fimbriimonas sp.]|nr:ATP-binding cassette domain-containing protein [Fimbriimonas sp.]